VFSDEIDDAPTSASLLDVRESERRNLRASQPAAEKDSEDGAITQTADRRDVGRTQQCLGLPLRKPVSDANPG
jgi:hypothetical protein